MLLVLSVTSTLIWNRGHYKCFLFVYITFKKSCRRVLEYCSWVQRWWGLMYSSLVPRPVGWAMTSALSAVCRPWASSLPFSASSACASSTRSASDCPRSRATTTSARSVASSWVVSQGFIIRRVVCNDCNILGYSTAEREKIQLDMTPQNILLTPSHFVCFTKQFHLNNSFTNYI